MPLLKHYDPHEAETRLMAYCERGGYYRFSDRTDQPVYSIDTPPPTVSGNLHLGHVYSYTHADLMARFKRMRGYNVFYPMGFDDNGLPTERLVEKRLGLRATQIGRRAFIEKCLQVSEEAVREYQALWQRLGLSVDWRYTYRTIGKKAWRISQHSFIELARHGQAYRKKAPAIWCPECRTALSQADLDDLERKSEFITLRFDLSSSQDTDKDKTVHQEKFLPIATTRPELLAACVAVFIHPNDRRYQGLAGSYVTVPVFGQRVPVLEDAGADPQKGTGAVMCCTFGDATDVNWWFTHNLPLVEALGRDGRLTQAAGRYAGLPIEAARQKIKLELEEQGLILDKQQTTQPVRVHERCDTPVEYTVIEQWFVRLLDYKDDLLQAGDQVNWHPEHMFSRYHAWVENLNWDWCISRQRYFGVPIPVWYCQDCGEPILADLENLPVDPTVDLPGHACPRCGGEAFLPDEDVLDTWATSSMSPQIVGGWLDGPEDRAGAGESNSLYARVFPFSLRPQAHEIIRTWAFYTIVKSHFHFECLPWSDVLVSGWGIAGEGMGKISKSRGGGPMSPVAMLERYSADALRYWASSTSPGKEAIISEEKIQMGAKLVNKLWNVARFAEHFIQGNRPIGSPDTLSSADRWILSRLQKLVRRVTALLDGYEYAAAKSELESFFWQELADNYLEMCKQRLYDEGHPLREGARFALYHVLLTVIQLFAPYLPFVTEEIYLGLFAGDRMPASIHISQWPVPDPALDDERSELTGYSLVEIATAVRRYKSERNLPLGTELRRLQLVIIDESALPGGHDLQGREIEDGDKGPILQDIEDDLKSITRAKQIEIVERLDPSLLCILSTAKLQAGILE